MQVINDYETITFLSNRYWLLYGSSSSYSIQSLPLYKIIGLVTGDNVVSVPPELTFNFNHHALVVKDTIEMDVNEPYDEYWLPIIFTPEFYEQDMIAKNNLFDRKKNLPSASSSFANNGNNMYSEHDKNSLQSIAIRVDEIRALVSMLSPYRVSDRCSWVDIGQSIYSALAGSEEGLDIFKHYTIKATSVFSSSSSSSSSSNIAVTDEDCHTVWNDLADDWSDTGRLQYTKATLEWMVRQDSPQYYECYREPKLRSLLFEALTKPETGTIGALFRAYYPFEYMFDNKEQMWYKYCQHYWLPCSPDDVMTLMNDDFINYLCRQQLEYSVKLNNSQSAEFRAQNLNVSSLINNLLMKMNKIVFKEQLLRELKVRYSTSVLHTYLDRNRDIFGCQNGVLDLRCVDLVRGIKPRFRPGKPEDFLSKHGTTYPADFTIDTPIVQECLKYISEVFRNYNIRQHFWRRMASVLKGGNTDKKFVNCVGSGDNSKTALCRLIEKAFKTYYCTASSTYLTSPPKGATDADPVMSKIINCRYVVFPEPNLSESVQEGTVKRITGRDDVTYRDLFQKGAVMKTEEPMFKTVIVSNKLVPIHTQQRSIWNRALVETYQSAWVHESELRKPNGEIMTYEEQYAIGKFLCNDEFERRLPKMAPAFLWLCVENYNEYCRVGLNPPREVLEATEEYRDSCNLYRRFIRDCLERDLLVTDNVDSQGQPITVINDNTFITVNETFSLFRRWFYDQKINIPVPEKAEFIGEMEHNMRKKTVMNENQKVFTGFKISPSAMPNSSTAGVNSAYEALTTGSSRS